MKNQSFDSFLASFKSLRIALSSGSCESVELALCKEKKCKCLLKFYGILSVKIKLCKQIIPAAKFAIRLAIANLRKLLDMI